MDEIRSLLNSNLFLTLYGKAGHAPLGSRSRHIRRAAQANKSLIPNLCLPEDLASSLLLFPPKRSHLNHRSGESRPHKRDRHLSTSNLSYGRFLLVRGRRGTKNRWGGGMATLPWKPMEWPGEGKPRRLSTDIHPPPHHPSHLRETAPQEFIYSSRKKASRLSFCFPVPAIVFDTPPLGMGKKPPHSAVKDGLENSSRPIVTWLDGKSSPSPRMPFPIACADSAVIMHHVRLRIASPPPISWPFF
jgi:hypothetical protein